MNSWAFAACAAATTSPWPASGLARAMFSAMLAGKITGSCGTTANCRRRCSRLMSRTSTSSSRIWPSVGSQKRVSRPISVLLPAPEAPAIPRHVRGSISNEMSWRTGHSLP